jgi:hypothetical protein
LGQIQECLQKLSMRTPQKNVVADRQADVTQSSWTDNILIFLKIDLPPVVGVSDVRKVGGHHLSIKEHWHNVLQ